MHILQTLLIRLVLIKRTYLELKQIKLKSRKSTKAFQYVTTRQSYILHLKTWIIALHQKDVCMYYQDFDG